MAMTLEDLLAPISEDRPTGDDLSYDPERQQIEQVFETDEFAASGAEADSAIDWRVILRLIESQFKRTKDVWLATYLCRAGARSGSLELVELGAQVLAGLFETYWDGVHPQLDELGLPGRKAPCDSLGSRKDFLAPLERVVLVAHPRLGAYNGLDFQRFRTGAEAEDGYGMFRAAIEELGDGALIEAIARLNRIEDGLRRADKVFMDAAAGEPSPNFAPSYATLSSLREAVNGFLLSPAVEPGVADGSGEEAAPAAGAVSAASKRISGAVETRDDVIRVLDAVADYYRRCEPSHPVQFIVQRAKAWVPMDFMELIKDIAPDSISQAGMLLNRRPTE